MQARTTGPSSLFALCSLCGPTPLETIAFLTVHAPHPHDPDASDAKCNAGRWAGRGRKDVPFHLSTNRRHHVMSDLKHLLRRMGYGLNRRAGTEYKRSIIRLRNDRPARTPLQAWFNRPIRDSSSFLEQVFLSPQSARRALRRCSLSACWELKLAGHCIDFNTQKYETCSWPARLCSAIGRPRWSAHVQDVQCYCAVRRGRCCYYYEVVQIVEDMLDTSPSQIPFQAICDSIEQLWR